MAFRIHDHVTRGEIDCRTKGEVTGTLWLHGKGGEVALKLSGNAWPDMAGCLLTFKNNALTAAMRRDISFAAPQEGAVGEMTASRKVRVPAIPLHEFIERSMAGEKPPERMANSLYLEWFSNNGRVVFESAECEITLSEPEWRLTPEEEEQRGRDVAEALAAFMEKFTKAIEKAESKVPWEKEKWDEFDHEKLLRESDATTDKYGELLDKYMDHPDRDRLIAREMGWDHIEEMLDAAAADGREEADDDSADADAAGEGSGTDIASQLTDFDTEDFEEPEPDPATEGKDWVRTEHGIKHPLSHRAFESAMALWHRVDELGLKDDDDEDLGTLVGEFSIVGTKLAGALDGMARGRSFMDAAHSIARMKRGLPHLHAAQAALVKVEERGLLPKEDLEKARAELFAIREEILRVMEELRRATSED